MEKKKDIELRSGKVRSIIGKMPGYYLRYGTIIVISVLALLTGILSSIKSETRITLDIKLLTSRQSYIYFSRDVSSLHDLLSSSSVVAKEDTLCVTISESAIIADIPSNCPLALHPGDTLDLLFDSGKTNIYAIVSKISCSKNTEPPTIYTILLTPVPSSFLSDVRNPSTAEISMGKQSMLSKLRNPIH